MAGSEILAYKEFVLRRCDLDVLEGQCYLNDDIIGFYFSYLSSSIELDDVLLVPPSVSFWLANASGEDLSAVKDSAKTLGFGVKRIIMFPINDVGGTHWSLLVYDRVPNAFYHLDTIKGANSLSAMDLFEKLKELVADSGSCKKKKKVVSKNKKCKDEDRSSPCFTELHTPQQMNDYDCGVYLLAIAKTICQWCVGDSKDKNWFAAVEKNVNSSVEFTMRAEILQLIEDLRARGNSDEC